MIPLLVIFAIFSVGFVMGGSYERKRYAYQVAEREYFKQAAKGHS